jgi:hypothetical protein
MNWRDKLLFFEAYILTGIARGAMLLIKFNKLKKYMGEHNTESPREVNFKDYNTVIRIRKAVLKASCYTPWESKCLVQALTVQKMLKKRKISATIYLGVSKDKDNNLAAHAWSRVGEMIVTGGELKDAFTQVSSFSS